MLRIINSNLYPEIIRATAIGYLSTYPKANAQDAVRKALNDPDPLLRREAAENYIAIDSAGLIHILVPLLGDPVKTVRMEAAYRLSTYRKDAFNETQYRLFRKALEEYKNSLEYLADFPSGRYNLGNYYSKTKDLPKAEENYREAIALDNLFYPAKINLAMLYYQEGKTEPAEKLFHNLITNHPEVPEGYYFLALLYGEQKRYPEAITLLETASTKPVTNPRIWDNLALLYQMTGQNDKCEVTATVKGAEETRVFSLGPMYQPKVPPTPSKNPLEGLELIFGSTSAMNFFGAFGAFSFFLNRSPMAFC